MTNIRKQQNTPSVICRGRRPLEVRDYVCMSSNLSGNSLEKGCQGTVLLGNVLIPGRIAQVFRETSLGIFGCTFATKISTHVCNTFKLTTSMI